MKARFPSSNAEQVRFVSCHPDLTGRKIALAILMFHVVISQALMTITSLRYIAENATKNLDLWRPSDGI